MSAPPELTVIQKKWRVDVRNPALEKKAITATSGHERLEQERKVTDITEETRNQQGMPAVTTQVPEPTPEKEARGLFVTYIYEVKVRNTATKWIRSMTWNYVFLEPGTGREVGRRRFFSEVSVGPGRTRNLVVRSAKSPTGTINATKAGKKTRDQYAEEVVVLSIEYADGSAWRATPK